MSELDNPTWMPPGLMGQMPLAEGYEGGLLNNPFVQRYMGQETKQPMPMHPDMDQPMPSMKPRLNRGDAKKRREHDWKLRQMPGRPA